MLVNYLFLLMAMSVGTSPFSLFHRDQRLRYCTCTCCKETVPHQLGNRQGFIRVSPECLENRNSKVPFRLQCPLSMCKLQTKYCMHWNQEICDTACLCSQCPNSTDVRCRGWNPNAVPGPMCKCKPLLEPPFCGSEFLFRSFQELTPELTCTIKCICSTCNDSEMNAGLPGMDAMCTRIPENAASNCTCSSCSQLLSTFLLP